MSKAKEILSLFEADGEVWEVAVELVWTGFIIFSSGEEGTSDNSTVLTFRYQNEDDAKKAEEVAKGFDATKGVKVSKIVGTGYPVFKEDLFKKILSDTVDPKVNQTIKTYKRYNKTTYYKRRAF